ncbi:hypothetical protein THRCLA_22834 [Thraustotheca clavata]|uniref:Uncharacterized protein n=1 Tax=Thraustotheca clavata TaxID=74557 RepID=A0A1V9YSK7_9STRA|nr:hypothetical protein THRCLA_22834 [Thraustotheca clavata]
MSDGVLMSKMGSYCCICLDAKNHLPTTLEASPPSLARVLDTSITTGNSSIPHELAFTRVLPHGFSSIDLFTTIVSPIEQVVREGFNTSVLCYGKAEAKRSLSLGACDIDPDIIRSLEQALAAYGQIGGIFFQLFQQITMDEYSLGLSCWSISGTDVVDHLLPLAKPTACPEPSESVQFITMEISAFNQALALLHASFAANAKQTIDANTHVFIRLAIYNKEQKELSLLHYCDLGHTLSPPEQMEFLSLFDDLVGFETTKNEYDEPALAVETTPRSCVLTQFVAPLLAGNSKTYLLGFVPRHSVQENLDWLWIMSGVRLITSACVKLTNIEPELLEFHQYVPTATPKSTLSQRLFGEQRSQSEPSGSSTALDWLDKFTHRKSQILSQLEASSPTNRPPSPLPPKVMSISTKSPLKENMVVTPIPETPLTPIREGANRFEEILYEAHLPSMAPPAPDVEGLDSKSALTVQKTEALLLRSNYDQLLRILKDQTHYNEQLQHKVDDTHFQLSEMQTNFDVQTQDLKLANVELRSKVRILEQSSGIQSLFDKYDAEMSGLLKEVEELRARNLELEIKLSQNANVDLRNRYREVVKENVALHEEILNFRKKERHFLSSKRIIDDSSRKIDKLSKLVSTKEDMLLEARLGEARLSAQVDQQQQKSSELQQQQSLLLQENEKATEELIAVKMYLASIKNEQRKADMLDSFVKKHGADLLSQDQRRFKLPKRGEPIVLDETLRKLLAAVKRALPQLVPTMNKLIQRLHEQEVTLIEYSTREMDLINLLVELASDQQVLNAAQNIAPIQTSIAKKLIS